MRPCQNCNDRDNHGGTFTDNQTGYGKTDGRFHVMLSAEVVDQIDRAHTAKLFRQLGYGRNGGFADAVEVAVNTGMHGSHRDGQGDDAQ